MTYRITKDKFLTEHEKNELLIKVACASGRDSLLICTLMHTGARASEVLGIKHSDVKDGQVYIRGLKGSNDREIPVPNWLSMAFHIISAECHADHQQLVFDIGYSRLVQIWKKVAPSEKSIKALRHTFAIELYKQTKDIFLVKRALGHRCITNTMVYVDYVLSTEHLQEIKKVNFYGLPRD